VSRPAHFSSAAGQFKTTVIDEAANRQKPSGVAAKESILRLQTRPRRRSQFDDYERLLKVAQTIEPRSYLIEV
jgi:hypothetical protein